MHELEKHIRDIPDFPKPGIVFKDITPLLKDPGGFKRTVEILEEQIRPLNPDLLLGIESRGFLFGGALAFKMDRGLIIARKPGKLPYDTDSLELHKDAVAPGQRVLIIDDLLATGGTAAACAKLVRNQQGKVAGHSFVVELAFLEGRKKLEPDPVSSILVF